MCLTFLLLPTDLYEVGTTLLSQTTNSQRHRPSIPKSSTWTATSTLQKLPTNQNGRVWDHNLTTIASTVQSKSYAPPPALSVVNTGRTSVSKLRKSFEAFSQLGEERKKPSFTRASANIQIISSVQKSVSALSTEAMDARRPSLDALDEETIETPPGKSKAFLSPMSSVTYQLKSPVWHSNVGRSSQSSPAQLPRRSKKAQGRQSHRATRPSKKDDPLGDEVSPTSSAGPGTPRQASSEPVAANQDAVPSVQLLEPDLPATQDLSNHMGETVQENRITASTKLPSKVAELRNVFDRKKHPAIPGDGPHHQPADDTDVRTVLADSKQPKSASALRAKNLVATKGTTPRRQIATEDTGVPLTCAIFTSPFRRDSTSIMPSPVRERISIFEGLIKPGPDLAQESKDNNKKPKQDRSKSQPCLPGSGILEGKKKSVGWLPKPFRKMSFHLGKSKGQPDDLARSIEEANRKDGNGQQPEAKAKDEAVEQSIEAGKHVPQHSSRSGKPRSDPQIQH